MSGPGGRAGVPAGGDASGAGAMSRAFGADVTVDRPPRGLYLVIGRQRLPDGPVRAAGGEVVVRLPERATVLAVLPVDAHAAVQRHPDVALAGPVTIDPDRFARFAAFAGLDARPTPTPGP